VRFIAALRGVLARETGDWTWLLQVFDAVGANRPLTPQLAAEFEGDV
jgi:hypothetical protein